LSMENQHTQRRWRQASGLSSLFYHSRGRSHILLLIPRIAPRVFL
jgi:hypothetical protein